jgi:extradiol dioxygenase family protein
VPFKLAPTIQDEGSPHEAGKFVIRDPAGNLIEFKYSAGAIE